MNPNNWKSTKTEPPQFPGRYLASRSGKIVVADYDTAGTWESCYTRGEYFPDHWMQIPEPPPRESSFEQWFRKCTVPCSDFEFYMKLAWDAAISASKNPDFVP